MRAAEDPLRRFDFHANAAGPGYFLSGAAAVAYTAMLYGHNDTFAASASMVFRESAALQNTNAWASV